MTASTASSPPRLGYLVPEFPGQTHVFFFRELRALERMGVGVELMSTRPPDRSIAVHAQGQAWADRTTYLASIGGGRALGLGARLIGRGPALGRWVNDCKAAGAEGGVKGALAAAVGAARLAELCKQRGVGHVHVHSCGRSALIAAAAHRLFGVGYSLTLHGPLVDYGPAQPLKWREARFGLIITRRLIEAARAELDGSLPDDVALAPMGVETDAWRRATPYRPWRGDGPMRLVSCGRLHEAKGHHVSIEAMRRLRAQGLPVELDVLGEDNTRRGYRQRLEAQIAEAGLGEAVRLRGAVDEAAVRELEGAAHAFVLASQAEPLGVAIMEAMAMGLPIVVTSAGGVPELVDEGRTGLMIEPEDPEATAQAIRRVAESAELASSLSAAARASVETQFSSDRSANELVAACRRQGVHLTDRAEAEVAHG
ncbi:MAG: exopolysaccharide biosynthesis GT4 family glycosyltransferase EpsE [Planctomycetota bacterium]